MPIGRKDIDQIPLTLKQVYKRDLAKRKLEQRIGQTIAGGVAPEIQALLHWCVIDEPARIGSVSFRKTSVHLEIDWPFQLPQPTDDMDTYFNSPHSVKRFTEEFKLYFLEQRCGAKLANVLRDEFERFLPRFFRTSMFGLLPTDSGASVGEALEAACDEMRSSQLAGRLKTTIPEKRAREMRCKGRGIIETLKRIRRKYSMKVEEITPLTEEMLLKQLEAEYRTDDYPWMKYFERSFRLLRPTKTWKRKGSQPLIAAPSSWETKGLAVQILRQLYLHEKGADYPLGAISKVMTRRSHSRD